MGGLKRWQQGFAPKCWCWQCWPLSAFPLPCSWKQFFLILKVLDWPWKHLNKKSLTQNSVTEFFSGALSLHQWMEFAQFLWRWFHCFQVHNKYNCSFLYLKCFWWQFGIIFLLVNHLFFYPGHKWDGAHRETGLAKCHDLCHSHLQVLWDLTSASDPPCNCSTIRAEQALLSSQQPLNPHVQLFYLTDPLPHTTATPSHTACCSSVFSNTLH